MGLGDHDTTGRTSSSRKSQGAKSNATDSPVSGARSRKPSQGSSESGSSQKRASNSNSKVGDAVSAKPLTTIVSNGDLDVDMAAPEKEVALTPVSSTKDKKSSQREKPPKSTGGMTPTADDGRFGVIISVAGHPANDPSEDTYVVKRDKNIDWGSGIFCGVFDGHGGQRVSEMLKTE